MNKTITKEEKVIKSPDLTVIKKGYANKWVALSSDYKKVLAVGDKLIDVLNDTDQSKRIVLKVLPNLGYAPTAI